MKIVSLVLLLVSVTIAGEDWICQTLRWWCLGLERRQPHAHG